MKTAILYHPGLGTDPDGPLCGARPFLVKLAAAIHAHIYIVAWNENGQENAKKASRALIDAGYQFIAVIGHSHGADTARDGAVELPGESLDVLALVDDCPFFDPLAARGSPRAFPLTGRRGIAFWQRNSEPTGIHYIGIPGKVEVFDVSDWAEPRLGHIDYPGLGLASIVGDDRVWETIEAVTLSAFNRKLLEAEAAQ